MGLGIYAQLQALQFKKFRSGADSTFDLQDEAHIFGGSPLDFGVVGCPLRFRYDSILYFPTPKP
jgi:hypothetical protein